MSCNRGWALLFWAFCCAVPAAQADDSGAAIPVRLTIAHVSTGEGGVDPRARKLQEMLERQQIRYPSIRVLAERVVKLRVGELGRFPLPKSGQLTIRLMHLDASGLLMALDVEGGMKTDVRLRDDHMMVLDAGPLGDGKRVVAIEPDYQ